MEMASQSPRRAIEQAGPAQDFPQKPVRGPHGGWQEREISALRERLDQAQQRGESLRCVFDEMGERLGRKPNSIRNFYYAQLRTQQSGQPQRALPFETFSQQEIESLIRSVLTARAAGMSVRACVRRLSGGDKARMLRYQNKYRSVVRTRPDLVMRIMAQLQKEGAAYVSPYPQDGEKDAREQMAQLRTRAQGCADAQVSQLFSSLEHLLQLAYPDEEKKAPDEENIDALRRADRLRAQLDLARIALDDERRRIGELRRETQGMITAVKEFIALPAAQRPERCEAFCRLASDRLSAAECALMEE